MGKSTSKRASKEDNDKGGVSNNSNPKDAGDTTHKNAAASATAPAGKSTSNRASEEDNNTNGARNKGNANNAGDTTHKKPNNKNDTTNVADHAGINNDTSSDKGSDGNNTDDASDEDSDTPENYAKPWAANSASELENAEMMDVGNNTDSDTSSARSLPSFAKSQSATKTEKVAKGS